MGQWTARMETFWDAQLAAGAVIALDAALPSHLVFSERWIPPVLTGVLLGALMVATPYGDKEKLAAKPQLRTLALVMLAVVVAVHIGSMVALVVDIVTSRDLGGGTLLRAAAQLWLATVLLFAVVYWEIDRGGPAVRSTTPPLQPGALPEHYDGPLPDFLFAQMDDSAPVRLPFRPGFVDYLYLAATNSTAFSPTDTLPLTGRAKLLMLVQSTTSFILVALVAARAVNVLA